MTEKFNKEKTLLLSMTSFQAPSMSESGMGSSRPLLDQLEQLRRELRESHEQHLEERKSLIMNFNLQHSAVENKGRLETAELKTKNLKLEETIQLLKEQCQLYNLEIKQLQNKNEALQQQNRDSLQEQSKLRNELKNMQQSIQATYRFDSSSPVKAGSSPISKGTVSSTSNNYPNDIEVTLKLQEAKYESKLRQMQNKLEFLKSQVETERKELDDTKVLLSTSMNERENLIQSYERKLSHLMKEHEERLQIHEEKIIANYEKRMVELSNLQKQFSIVSNQSNDLQNQNSLIHQQFESSQATVAKLQVQILNYQTEIEEYKRLVTKFESEKVQDLMKENQKVSQETLIKRLDNERNYLKSQLKSEIVLKNELQNMLDEANRLLRESQVQWNKDVEKLQIELQSLQQAEQRKEAERNLEFRQLEEEKVSLYEQLSDLKEGFQKSRNQLKMEQIALEQMTSARDKVLQQVQQLQQEVHSAQSQLETTQSHYQKQVEAIRMLLQNTEDKLSKEIILLKDELRNSLEQHSLLSSQIFDLKEQQRSSQITSLRKLFLMRIVKMNSSFDRLKLLKSFKRWTLNNSLMKIANQFKQHMEKILVDAKNNMEKDKLQSLDSQKHELTRLKIEEMSKLSLEIKADAKREREDLLQKFEEEKALMQQKHESIVEELEKDHQFDMAKLQTQFTSMKEEVLQQIQLEREQAQKAHAKEINMLMQRFYDEELVTAKAVLRKEMEDAHNSLITQKLKEGEEELVKMKRNHEIDLDFQLYEQRKVFDKEIESIGDKHEREKSLLRTNQDFLLEKQRKEADEALLKARSRWAEETERRIKLENEECRRILHEQHEQQLQALKEIWQQECEDKLKEEVQIKEELFQERIRILTQEKDLEKTAMMKQETKKWKAIMQEQNKTQEAEIQKVIIQTKNECEKQFQQEKELLMKNIELEKLKERDSFSLRLQEIQIKFDEEKGELIESERKKLQQQMRDYHSELRETFQKDFDEQFAASLLVKTEEFTRLLSLEQKKHDSLKEDFSKQMKLFAKERDNLLREQQSLEKQLEMHESMHKEAIQAEKLRSQEEKETMLHKFDEERHQLQTMADKARLNALDEQKEEMQRLNLIRIEEEKEILKSQFDLQLSQIQQENERLIKQLESALSELKQQKQHLSDDLVSLTQQLQETDDALFDANSAKDKLQVSRSVMFWQCLTKLQQLKLRFQRGIQEFDSEAKKRFQNLQTQLTNEWNDLALQFMRATALIHEFDAKRLSLLSKFNQAKQQEEMHQSKRNIQLLEYDIDRLHSEKHSLEENKATLLKDIDNLTLEIKEQEELIRQHHAQESAMTIHGRVNIVFARKKRRLDQEIERLLELMETKRNQIAEIEDKIVSKVKNREEKELLLIQYEHQFVAVIIQQQKEIYKELVDWQSFAERTKGISQMIRFPYPPVAAINASLPEITMQDVTNLVERWKAEDTRKERMNSWKEEEKEKS